MSQFVINKGSGNFATSLGKFHLKPGEAKPVTEQELMDEELSYAITLGLLELSDSPNVIVENPPLGALNLDTSLVQKPVEVAVVAEEVLPVEEVVAVEVAPVVAPVVEAPVSEEPTAETPVSEEPTAEVTEEVSEAPVSTKTSRKKSS